MMQRLFGRARAPSADEHEASDDEGSRPNRAQPEEATVSIV